MIVNFLMLLPFLALVIGLPIAFFISALRRRKMDKVKLGAEQKENAKTWGQFGYMLIILSVGAPFVGISFADFPWWMNALVLLLGIGLVLSSRKKSNAQ